MKEQNFNIANGVPSAPSTSVTSKKSNNNNNDAIDSANLPPGAKINPRTGKVIMPVKPAEPSLQQQVYLASLKREEEAKAELLAKQEYLQLYGEQQVVPPLRPISNPPGAPANRPRSGSPMNDDMQFSPRSVGTNGGERGSTPNQPIARPVNSAGLSIGVPLMGKQTRAGLQNRVNV